MLDGTVIQTYSKSPDYELNSPDPSYWESLNIHSIFRFIPKSRSWIQPIQSKHLLDLTFFLTCFCLWVGPCLMSCVCFGFWMFYLGLLINPTFAFKPCAISWQKTSPVYGCYLRCCLLRKVSSGNNSCLLPSSPPWTSCLNAYRSWLLLCQWIWLHTAQAEKYDRDSAKCQGFSLAILTAYEWNINLHCCRKASRGWTFPFRSKVCLFPNISDHLPKSKKVGECLLSVKHGTRTSLSIRIQGASSRQPVEWSVFYKRSWPAVTSH